MKKNLIYTASLLLVISTLSGCTQQERPELEERITDLRIIVQPGEKVNSFVLSTNYTDVIGYWNLGNGIMVEAANTTIAEYPFAGTYAISVEGYGQGGKTNKATAVIPVVRDNYEFLEDPIYPLICGGINNDSGKTWVIDAEFYGHISNLNTTNPDGNAPNNRALPKSATANYTGSDLRFGPTIYDDEMTFFLTAAKGPAFEHSTGDGKVLVSNTGSNAVKNEFMKTSSWAPTAEQQANSVPLPIGFTFGYNSDWQITCTPPKGMTWLIVKGADGSYSIKFPATPTGAGGFMLFALDWGEPYDIKSITENRLIVRKKTSANNSIRQLYFIKKGTASGLDLTPEEEDMIQNGITF